MDFFLIMNRLKVELKQIYLFLRVITSSALPTQPPDQKWQQSLDMKTKQWKQSE
jgi:hypothetical protein